MFVLVSAIRCQLHTRFDSPGFLPNDCHYYNYPALGRSLALSLSPPPPPFFVSIENNNNNKIVY